MISEHSSPVKGVEERRVTRKVIKSVGRVAFRFDGDRRTGGQPRHNFPDWQRTPAKMQMLVDVGINLKIREMEYLRLEREKRLEIIMPIRRVGVGRRHHVSDVETKATHAPAMISAISAGVEPASLMLERSIGK